MEQGVAPGRQATGEMGNKKSDGVERTPVCLQPVFHQDVGV